MLEKLQIQNLALVSDISLEFERGLTVFTGETGTGKTMLLSSLLLLSGEKADARLIRVGADTAVVYGEWNIASNRTAQTWLNLRGLNADEQRVSVRRVLKSRGRSQCFIQGSPVSVNELADFSALLCEIHTQHEHQALFRVSYQTILLDAYAKLEDVLQRHRNMQKDLEDLLRQYLQADSKKEEIAREWDYLHYSVQEIENARLQDNEDESLLEAIQAAAHSEEIHTLWAQLTQYTDDEEHGLTPTLERVLLVLQVLQQHKKELTPFLSRYESLQLEYADLVSSLKAMSENEEQYSAENLARMEQRLSVIEGLKRKYGKSIAHIQEFHDTSIARIKELENHEYDETKMQERIVAQFKNLFQLSQEIYAQRIEAAQRFSSQTNEILTRLAMPNANLEFRFSESLLYRRYHDMLSHAEPEDAAILQLLQEERCTLLPSVELFISTNKGIAAQPLSKIVSGGELSRIMLAMSIVRRFSQTVETLVLDEVDTGVGGKTAVALAACLNDISTKHQILCVSHLPVVAATATQHFHLKKTEVDQKTSVEVEEIAQERREEELARMLVGNEGDTLALQQAKQLLLQKK